MVKVTVITPSIRIAGLEIVRKSLREQSFKNFEWLICSRKNPKIDEAIWIQDNFIGGFWSLNRAYNALFKKATGQIIITIQDWIWIPADGIQKFVNNLQRLGEKSIISGVGNQYERVDKFGRPEIKIWSDPRKTNKYGSFYECFPADVEWNWAAFWRKSIFDVGGMDENLDFLGYGGDQLQVGKRLDELGYKSYLDQSNESFTIRHGREDFGGEDEWNRKHVLFNGEYDKEIARLKKEGKWPKLDYLKEV